MDVAAKQLTTAAGDTIAYGKLVVATGARVRRTLPLGWGLQSLVPADHTRPTPAAIAGAARGRPTRRPAHVAAACPTPGYKPSQPVTLADFKTPGADLQGVHTLRNVQDADALLSAIQACKAAGGKVGGGAFHRCCRCCGRGRAVAVPPSQPSLALPGPPSLCARSHVPLPRAFGRRCVWVAGTSAWSAQRGWPSTAWT